MKRIAKYLSKYKLLLFIPSTALLLSIVLDLFNPYLSKIMIDEVITKRKINLLLPVLLCILGIAVGRTIFGYTKEYLFDVLSTKLSIDLKLDLFNHIENMHFQYFDKKNTGELMSRISEDIDTIWQTVSFGLRLLVENSIYFILATVILFSLNFKLALICLLTTPAIAYVAVKMNRKIDKTYGDISDQAAIINTTAQENISGVRLVKAFAREKHEILKFLSLNNKNYDLNMKQQKTFAKYFPRIEFLTNVSNILLIALGGIFVIKGFISVGTLVAFTGYISMLINPMRNLGWITNLLARSNASCKKIFKIMDTEPGIKSGENAIVLKDMQGKIEFKHVDFKYIDEVVLKDINFTANKGSVIAIMGATGSGKSSIINLIGRYYDVLNGEVLIDNHDVKDLDLKNLRENMSVVSQDTFLFSDSILQNVKLGNNNASFDEIKKACDDACASEFIDELPDGFDTVIGERGIGLSGGQKQRLSIARALLRKSKIMILDDATSALDMETEYNLLKNLKNRNEKPTTFIIAHRISAVKNADCILFLDKGRIVESGTHKELLKKRGKYYEIYSEQFKSFDDVDEKEVVNNG